MDIEYSVLDIGYSVLVIGYSLLDIGYSLLDIGYSLLVIGYSLLDIPCWILDIGFICSVPIEQFFLIHQASRLKSVAVIPGVALELRKCGFGNQARDRQYSKLNSRDWEMKLAGCLF